MCSLHFDIEENTIIEAFVRFRFASVAITRADIVYLTSLPPTRMFSNMKMALPSIFPFGSVYTYSYLAHFSHKNTQK